MVTVNGNILQLLNGGKQGTQSKATAKEGNILNGDFLMALFAAVDGQQTTTDVTQLLGENQDQQQSAEEGQQNLLAHPMKMLFAKQQNDLLPMDALNLDTDTVQDVLKEAQQAGEVPKQVDAVLLGKLESLLVAMQQPHPTSELKEILHQIKEQLPNQPLAEALPVQLDAKPVGKQEEILQQVPTELLNQLKEQQPTGGVPQKIDAVLLGKLERLLADPMQISELKEIIQQVKVQLPNQPLAEALPVQIDAKSLVKQDGLLQHVPTELQQALTEMLDQFKDQQPTGGVPKQVGAALHGKLESLLASPQLQLMPELKEVLQQLQVQQVNQQLTGGVPKQIGAALHGKLESLLASPQLQLMPELKEVLQQVQVQQVNQQPVDVYNEIIEMPQNQNESLVTTNLKQKDAEVVLKTESLAAELPKAGLVLQNKGSTGVQPVEKSTDSQNFATVIYNKMASVDAKVDLVQPEQLAGKLLGMVKEMATKQQPNQTTMHIKLNPEHLGEVTIRLTYNRGELNAQFYAATAHGKEALEAALPQMRDALFQQQVKLNEAAVYLNNGGNQWQGGRQGNQGGNRGRSQGGYYNNNSIQTKVGAVLANNNKAIDDGLNLLI